MQLYKASRRRLQSRRFKTSAQTNTCNDKVLPRASSRIHTHTHVYTQISLNTVYASGGKGNHSFANRQSCYADKHELILLR